MYFQPLKSTPSIAITPSSVHGLIHVPPSKSMMQRACAAALLHQGTTTITHPGCAADDLAALQLIQDLGAHISYENVGSLTITSNGIHPNQSTLNCGESGLSARMFSIIAATSMFKLTLDGEGSLLQRPMHPLVDILQQGTVTVTDFNGYLPITFKGPFQATALHVNGSLSSQYLSGLLIALAFTAKQKVVITVDNLTSKPYIDMTLAVLKDYGRAAGNENYQQFYITPINQPLPSAVSIDIEADWSSAAYWIVAALLNGKVQLQGLSETSCQADSRIMEVVLQSGGRLFFKDGILSIEKTEHLKPFSFDANDSPDLFPILAVFASACEGISSIRGLHRLLHKESNRKQSILALLEQFGIPYSVEEDTLNIVGVPTLKAATIDSFNDHRIAMAASIAALRANGKVVITQADCVAKSYPDFFLHLQQLGVSIATAL